MKYILKVLCILFLFSTNASSQWMISGGVNQHFFKGSDRDLFLNSTGYRVQLSYSRELLKFGAFYASHNITSRYDTTFVQVVDGDGKPIPESYRIYGNTTLQHIGVFTHLYLYDRKKIKFSGGLDVAAYILNYHLTEHIPGIRDLSDANQGPKGLSYGPSLNFTYKLSKHIALDLLVKESFIVSKGVWQNYANVYAGIGIAF